MMYECKGAFPFSLRLGSACFSNFYINRLAALKAYQATYVRATHFLGFCLNHLAVVFYSLGDANWCASFMYLMAPIRFWRGASIEIVYVLAFIVM